MPTLQETLNALRDFAQGASNSVASNVSAPVDALAWLLRKGGVPMGDAPVGGSAWMAQHGLTAQPRNRLAELAGETAGMIGPMAAAAKAPQIAAKLLQGADNLNAPRQLSKEAGVFAGHLSKTADLNALAKAKQLQAQGVPDEQIYKQTGWFNGMPDKQWRYEIPDNAATLSGYDPTQLMIERYRTGGKEAMDAFRAESAGYKQPAYRANLQNMDEVLDHRALYDAYPEAGYIKYLHDSNNPVIGQGGFGTYRGQPVITTTPQNADLMTSTQLHELQHALQKQQGFARGGGPDDMPVIFDEMAANAQAQSRKLRGLAYSGDPLNPFDLRKPGALDKALDQDALAADYRSLAERTRQFPSIAVDYYRNLAGEAEARLVEARKKMTPAERAASYPPSMFDVPAEQQIVRFGNALSRK